MEHSFDPAASPPRPASAQADVLACPAPRLTVEDCAELLTEHWGLASPQVSGLPSERDLNALVDGRYVLKVSNPAEAAAVVDLETQALAHAARVDPGLPLPRTVPTLTGAMTATIRDADDRECLVRVITVVPGEMAEGLTITPPLAEAIGGVGARMSIALQGLFHPAAARVLDWDVRRADQVLAAVDPEVLDTTTEGLAELRSRCRTPRRPPRAGRAA